MDAALPRHRKTYFHVLLWLTFHPLTFSNISPYVISGDNMSSKWSSYPLTRHKHFPNFTLLILLVSVHEPEVRWYGLTTGWRVRGRCAAKQDLCEPSNVRGRGWIMSRIMISFSKTIFNQFSCGTSVNPITSRGFTLQQRWILWHVSTFTQKIQKTPSVIKNQR